MYTSDKRNDGMIKIKKRNYLSEKKEKLHMDKEIKTGIIMTDKIEDIWRGKNYPGYPNSYPEERYMLNQIMKKYQSNKDERSGYNYKYILELTNLLGGKDKDFSKKRLELYNNRVQITKKQYNDKNEKYLLKSYKKTYNIPSKFNYRIDKFNKKNQMNNKYKTYNSFYNKGKKNNNDINRSFKMNNNNKYGDIYTKTSYNYNSPSKVESLKFLLSNKKCKSSQKGKMKNIKNQNVDSNYTSSLYLTQFNMNNDESFDTTSLVGKEDFLVSGDREKYHEYLQKEYKFFDVPRIRQLKFMYDKQKRIKLFKKMPNAKFLNYKKEDPLKTEIFKRIKRESYNQYLDQNYGLRNDTKIRFPNISNKSIKKLNFYKDCNSILANLKKHLCI
jgi:hypothetical protein